jgi:hypothetical protein
MLNEHPDGTGIAFPSGFTHPGQLKSVGGLVAPEGFFRVLGMVEMASIKVAWRRISPLWEEI